MVKGTGNSTSGTVFVKPFTPMRYRATVNPTVDLGRDRVTMIVTGRCSVSYRVVRQGKPATVTFTRTRFTYYIQPQASQADPRVGVSGWQSNSSAKYADR